MDTGNDFIAALDAAHARVCAAERDLLLLAAEAERFGSWRVEGARDAVHWLSMRFGISSWKARRWIAAGKALPSLPAISSTLASGRIGVDKVLELVRFATPDSEVGLIRWALGVTCATIRQRGDRWDQDLAAEREAHQARRCHWWFSDEGRRFNLEAELPAAQGKVIAQALNRVAASIPVMPDEEGEAFVDARRADALSALASASVARDADPDRATVVIHADLDGLLTGTGGCEIEGGPAVHPETVNRLLCNARSQTVVEDRTGNVSFVSAMRREPSAWMLRQVRYRDRGCVFPGCGARAFTEAHHIKFWRYGGKTELSNLALICSFHHRLVHEDGWSLVRQPAGALEWRRPGGTRYRAGPRVRGPDLCHGREAPVWEASESSTEKQLTMSNYSGVIHV